MKRLPIHRALWARGWTVKRLALETGRSMPHVSQVIAGKVPSPRTRARIAPLLTAAELELVGWCSARVPRSARPAEHPRK